MWRCCWCIQGPSNFLRGLSVEITKLTWLSLQSHSCHKAPLKGTNPRLMEVPEIRVVLIRIPASVSACDPSGNDRSGNDENSSLCTDLTPRHLFTRKETLLLPSSVLYATSRTSITSGRVSVQLFISNNNTAYVFFETLVLIRYSESGCTQSSGVGRKEIEHFYQKSAAFKSCSFSRESKHQLKSGHSTDRLQTTEWWIMFLLLNSAA